MVRDLMQINTLTPRECGLANCPSSASPCSDWPSRLHPCLTSTKCLAIAFQIQSHGICYTLDSPQQTDHVKIQQGSVRASEANMHTNRNRLDLPHYSHVCFFLELYSRSQRGSWWDPNKYRARELILQITHWQFPSAAAGLVTRPYFGPAQTASLTLSKYNRRLAHAEALALFGKVLMMIAYRIRRESTYTYTTQL